MTAPAYMFPGQGAQFVPMGRDLCEKFSAARDVFETAEDACGLPLRKLCFEGPIEELSRTNISQPALVAASMAALVVAREKGIPEPSFVLGLSLGEYSALCAAGALSLEDAIRLVHLRGTAMQEAAERNPGGMTSILGADEDQVYEIVNAASPFGVVNVANFNCPGQVVVSGSFAALDEVERLAAQVPRVRAVRLNVSGAFHSPLMQEAADKLANAIETVEWHNLSVPVVSNVSAQPITDIATIKANLVAQLTGSVQFERSITGLKGLGVTRFFEIGPSKVLMGLMRRIDRELSVTSVGTAAEVAAL